MALGLHSAPASAQATRTWVSGVGDDANPCSRTAPCKTFAGAISKTAAGGEINCLDPGGFGALTITKSISIICDFTEAGVLVAGAGVNGMIVNAGANDTIYLSGIDFNGAGSAQNGLRILAGSVVHVQNSLIRNFRATNGVGISFQPSGNTMLTVLNTTIDDNGSGATGGGMLVQPTGAAGTARLQLRDVRFQNNANNALRIDTTGNTGPGISVLVDNVELTGGANGISINVPAGTSAVNLLLQDSVVTNLTGTGLAASGSANATMRVSDTTITLNGTGVSATGGANIQSFGNNRLLNNTSNGAFTGAVLPES